MPSGVRVIGFNKIGQKIALIRKRNPQRFAEALGAEMDIETAEAKRRTPVDKGNLQDSVRTIGPDINGTRITAGIAAGNESVDYAIYVHEDLEARHPNGQAKFIESVIDESRPYMSKRIAARLRRET